MQRIRPSRKRLRSGTGLVIDKRRFYGMMEAEKAACRPRILKKEAE